MKLSIQTLFLLFLLPLVFSQSIEDLLLLGTCEPFDSQPSACIEVMVGSWSSVWTVPGYGLTQEYWAAQMNLGSPISPIDSTHLYPSECANHYLKLVCPTFFQPCTTVDNDLIPFSAIPHSPCRSVCLVCYDIFSYLISFKYYLFNYYLTYYYLLTFFKKIKKKKKKKGN